MLMCFDSVYAHVWVAAEGHSIVQRNIHVGRAQHGWVEVAEGLQPEERIVVSGALFIDRAVKSN